jgi:hypothetical protein
MKWHFFPQPLNLVETEVTQRDQFRNDDVDLADTIVRESVQNSLDACLDGQKVRVSFTKIDEQKGLNSDYLHNLFEGQRAHAEAAGFDVSEATEAGASAIVVEDFGTRGLTGSIGQKDEDNFSDFWRRHGRSHKTGKSRGRWGLGKLVYSSSSMLSSFFGLTIRPSDSTKLMMGQTVLGLHRYEGIEYPAHAFFSGLDQPGTDQQLQIPIADTEFLNEFCSQFSLTRGDSPGLSIVIPFPNPELDITNMIGVGIANYFYPIMTEQLSLVFDGLEVTSENIRQLAHEHAREKFSDIDELFDFIEEVHAKNDLNLVALQESWADNDMLDEGDFGESEVEAFRTAFSKGRTVAVSLPIEITRKDGTVNQTSFSLFIKRPEDILKGQDLYVRGGLTLPGEAKFNDRKALGIMIAEDEPIADFLGDAENAAHTRWISRAEKLRKHYRSPERKLRIIRKSLVNFYDLLAQTVEEEDEAALMSFFFTDLPETSSTPRRRGKTPKVVVSPQPRTPAPCSIMPLKDGFSVRPGAGADEMTYPIVCHLKVAYDLHSGNPFKKYDQRDFNLTSKGNLTIKMTKETINIIEAAPNVVRFEIKAPHFGLDITGFDVNRDLQIKVQTLEN